MKRQNGITLIALIITIIVMLILVGVTVIVALNGGLFDTTKEAANKTQIEADKEILQAGVIGALNKDLEIPSAEELQKNLPDGWEVTGNGPFTCTSPKGNIFIVDKGGNIQDPKPPVDLPKGWTETDKPEGWSDKVTAITDGENTIPLPNGFEISKEETEDSIEEGLVLKDGANEFVWIPVENAGSYIEDNFGSLTGTDTSSNAPYDSQETLDYYYGKKEDGSSYYNYDEDFTYEQDKANVERSIQTYGGFYVGRYETTIDGNTIGVQNGKTVLTSDKTIEQTNNKAMRWWGLYKVQKDMYANNESVGSLMISSKQWDAIMEDTKYGDAKRPTDSYKTKPDLSGAAYSTNTSKCDVSNNIYDLAGNVLEWTMRGSGTDGDRRVVRGGSYNDSKYSASRANWSPSFSHSNCRQ